MSLWDKSGQPPKWLNRAEKRNLVLTSIGWVRKLVRGTRTRSEIYVPLNNAANAAGRPVITDVWHSGATFSAGGSPVVNTWISFSQPISSTSALKITVANTAGGAVKTANANTTVYGSNKLLFRWTANAAGTYKVQAQTIANGSATAANIRSTNAGNTVSLRVISGTVSNTSGTITVTA